VGAASVVPEMAREASTNEEVRNLIVTITELVCNVRKFERFPEGVY
jgi:hypothetical protein